MAWALGTTLHQHPRALHYTENHMPHQQSGRRLQPQHPQVKANHTPSIISPRILPTHVLSILVSACMQRDDHNSENDVAVHVHALRPTSEMSDLMQAPLSQ